MMAPRDGAPASSLRGNSQVTYALEFVRFEPYVVPKASLTGDTTERVDTRVLQVIYRFKDPKARVFDGQQMDVYIDAATRGPQEATQSSRVGK
jgi:hypothetical protein